MATKIVTKNSSTASAVPTASDLVQGELAVNVADKRLFTENNAGAIVELGTNPSALTVTGEITANGGIALGDNDKATFGAGDDLQLYHDGSNSYIDDTATGHLFIRSNGDGIYLRSNTNEEIAHFNVNGSVKAYYDNSLKLATTSTGIDVTGLVVSDGMSTNTAGTSNFIAGVNAGNSIASGGVSNVLLGDEAGTAITTGSYNVIAGHRAGDALDTGGNNVAIGWAALTLDTKGDKSTAVGRSALASQNFTSATDSYNVAMGYLAGSAVTTGVQNTLIGGLAGDALTDSDYNVAVGYGALTSDTLGARNVAIGQEALASQNFTSATNSYNTAVGMNAGRLVTTGINNTLIGGLAGDALTDADSNTAIGYNALTTNTLGSAVTAVGSGALALHNVTSAAQTFNTAVGYDAGNQVTTGTQNTLIGGLAGDAITTASSNTAVGFDALTATTTGANNTASGTYALASNTTGANNVSMGYNSLGANTTASNNTSVGFRSLQANTTSSYNTAFGNGALISNTVSSYNTAVGNQALYIGNRTADANGFNTAVGHQAGYSGTTAQFNTFIGQSSGYYCTTGSKNTIVGCYTGNFGGLDIRTSSNNIVLSDGDGNPHGYYSGSQWVFVANASGANVMKISNSAASNPYGPTVVSTNSAPNNTSIYAFETGDYTAVRMRVWSNGNIVNVNNSYGAYSDVKLKENIIDAPSQWDDIKNLTVRKYSLKTDNLDAPNMLGVVAQEVEAAGMGGLVYESPDLDRDNNDLGTVTKQVNYSILYMKAVKALQEAMNRIESLEERITTLEG